MAPPTSRRAFLGATGSLVGGLFLGSGASAAQGVSTVKGLVSANWLTVENQQTGDGSWLLGQAAPAGALEGYASATSVNLGGTVSFFVSTTSPTLSAKVYRIGYYQGHGARLVETVSGLKGAVRAIPAADEYGTIDCHWPTTFRLNISRRYVAGQYLVRLEDNKGQFRFVPFLVRDDTSKATFVYMSSVTTWQAYNKWGGYSLYEEANQLGTAGVSNARRAVRVSFNRPYDRTFANGAADFMGNEFPLLYLAERLSLDMTYWTDIDLHQRGNLLSNHRALLSLGHDEYYSPSMRSSVTNAVNRGVNVAFFGANFCYRKIRFEPSVNGADRLMVNYRSTADPIYATNVTETTVNWSQSPSDMPESTFSGSLYGGVNGTGSLEVVDAASWLWRGAGLSDNAVLPGALGGEFNRFDLASQNPTNVQILAHSRVVDGLSDVTYVAEKGRGGVFSSGTGHWVFDLSDGRRLRTNWIPAPRAEVTAPLTVATQNIFTLFGSGPSGTSTPSLANTSRFY